ncbi:hypothetical protein SPHINGO391_470197 [Sphingomonas aurantiaca]|uniref:Uncharacterized protein n=1 Tax=Sphingomonas aurantiaca TaxID=185949 RepID=A0A5E7ZQF1_9SPHN|nr:hypothetical protein SPHINGO391_470197 [Sphingomonas aurantiaca]
MMRESCDRARCPLADQPDILLGPGRALVFGIGLVGIEGGAQQRRPPARGDSKRSASAGGRHAQKRKLGLREQLEQVGARAAEPDFDHLRGHRDDLVDRGEKRCERIARAGCDLSVEDRNDLIGGDWRTVAPIAFAQAEDIAHAAVDHDPALGQAGLDLACGVEPDQALRGRVDQQAARRVGRLAAGIDETGRGADRADDDGARIGPSLIAAAQYCAEPKAEANEKSRFGADGGTRTRTPREGDFKSPASTGFATSAHTPNKTTPSVGSTHQG